MKRLGAYPNRLKKNKISKPSRYRSLRWAVIEGDGDGHTICLKDADTSDSICQRICLRMLINQTQGLSADLHRTDSLKEPVNHPRTVRLVWAYEFSELH